MTPTPLIVLEDVGRAYRLGEETVRVLDQVRFTLGAGERCAVVGPSGSEALPGPKPLPGGLECDGPVFIFTNNLYKSFSLPHN